MSKEDLINELEELESSGVRPAARMATPTVEDYERLIHDLHTHQVELEMQNRELRESQDRLQDAVARYADLYDFAPVGYCTLAPEGHILEINLAGAAVLGAPRRQLTGKTFGTIASLKDSRPFEAHLARCAREEGRVTSEVTLWLGTRGAHVVQVVSEPLRDADGKANAYRTMLIDISELKELEAKLRVLSEAGIALAGSLDVATTLAIATRIAVPGLADLCMVDLLSDGGDVDRVAVVFADPKKQDALAERVKSFTPRRGWRSPQARVIESGEPTMLAEVEPLELQRLTYDDDQASALRAAEIRSLMVVPLAAHGRSFGALTLAAAESGRYYGASDLLLAQDLASRIALALDNARLYAEAQKTNDALRLAEKDQRFLADVGLVLATTLDYDETLSRILELAVRDLSDVCIVDIVGEGSLRRLKVVSRDAAKAEVCDALARVPLDPAYPTLTSLAIESGRPFLIENVSPAMVASLAQGEEHFRLLSALEPCSVIAVPLIVHGRILGAMALVSSAPSRVYAHADLSLVEELARRAALSVENARLYHAAGRAVQARDDVLGIVAHDLRNPLSLVLFQAKLLRRPSPRDNSTYSTKPAEVIERAATRMNRLIEDLLDVTRLEAGRLAIEKVRVPPSQLICDALDAQKVLASSFALELRAQLVANLPEVEVDRDRFSQVLENLVGNAFKFTKPGGSVTVGAAPRASEILFWVSDTGAGLASQDLPHIFDRFWQARKADRQGAGLGLAIVKGIVDAHGGRVWAESELGIGTTFFFTLPRPTSRSERPLARLL